MCDKHEIWFFNRVDGTMPPLACVRARYPFGDVILTGTDEAVRQAIEDHNAIRGLRRQLKERDELIAELMAHRSAKLPSGSIVNAPGYILDHPNGLRVLGQLDEAFRKAIEQEQKEQSQRPAQSALDQALVDNIPGWADEKVPSQGEDDWYLKMLQSAGASAFESVDREITGTPDYSEPPPWVTHNADGTTTVEFPGPGAPETGEDDVTP